MDLLASTALVTGASSGIGTEFARQLAAEGADLVLVARRRDALEALAKDLSEAHGVRVRVLTADLTAPDAAEHLVDELTAAGTEIDVLVNSAGFGLHGDVVDADPDRQADMVRLNCLAVVELTTRLLPGMVARRHGAVLNVASTAAFQPLGHMAVYGASKAFVLSYTEALWAEVREFGVRVVALCPGATDTAFFDTAGDSASVGPRLSPADVAAAGLARLQRGGPTVIPGRRNALLAALPRLFPRAVTADIAARTLS